jgi:diguanylate cyclase
MDTQLLDQLPCAVLATDARGFVLGVNSELLRLSGEAPAALLNQHMDALFPPAGRIFLQTHVWPSLMRDGRVAEIFLQLSGPGGQRLPVMLNCHAGQLGDGRAYYWTLFVATERHRFEAQLVEARRRAEASERFTRTVTDAIPAMVGYWDQELRCKFANPPYLEWFGRDPSTLIGTRMQDLLGERLFALNEPLARAALAGEPQHFERSLLKLDGTLGHTQASYIPDIVDGKVRGFLALVTDISALKIAEALLIEEISERKREHRLLLESSSMLQEAQRLGQIGSWSWVADGGQTLWSDQLYTMFGRDRTLSAPSLAERSALYLPDDLARLNASIGVAMQTGAPFVLELQFKRPNGQPGWIETRGEVTRDSRGRITGLRGTAQDISARKQIESELRKSQDFLGRAGELAGVGGWEVNLATRSVYWSDAVCQIHGVPMGYQPSLDEAIDFYDDASRPIIQAAVAEAMAGGPGFELELRIRRRDGKHRWIRTVGSVEFAAGQAVRMIGAFQDVTKKVEQRQALAEQHEMLRVTLQSIGDAVITTNAEGEVSWMNPVAERMTGWLAREALGLPLHQVFHIVNEETRALMDNPVATCLALGEIVGLANHTLLISRDGREYGIEDSAAPIRNDAGEALGVVLVFHDVSEQRRMSGEMTYRATHDALTGLVNRAEFETRLQRLLRKSQEEQSEHALLYIDLDQFKLVNDACGHAVGDLLLKQVSKLLAEAIRARDTLARLGGDEFAIILEHCSQAQAQQVAQKICDRMEVFRFLHEERRFRIGTSIGLVPVDRRWSSTAAIQQAADTSCYAAKEAGRNRVHVWFDTDVAMQARQLEMQWTSRIERALDEGGLLLFAQRIEPLKPSNAGMHAEVLLRLKNEDGSLVPPGAFLPAAERFNLISRIDRWVLSQALQWLQGLPEPALVACLSVNLSGQSVGDRAFHAWATELLASVGSTVCTQLCLEITETAAVTNLGDAAVFIRQVRAAGVKVALDDFGAGASSFGYLKSLPVDYLKIDGQFVRDVVTDALDDAAVRCFVDVARVVGVQTVAEFVEQPDVLRRLEEIGVDYAQGYLLHRPAPLASLLVNRHETAA